MRPTCADEICGHDRLSVAGRQCVERTEAHRDHERDEDTDDVVRSGDRDRQGVAGRRQRDASGTGTDVERRGDERLRVRREPCRDALARKARAERGAVAMRDDLAPADAVRVVSVLDVQDWRGDARREPGAVTALQAERVQATLAGRKREPRGGRQWLDPMLVDAHDDPGGEIAAVPSRIGLDHRTLLERGDLGHVDHVIEDHGVRPYHNAQVVVDGEVAERVRVGRSRRERECDAEQDSRDPALHRAAAGSRSRRRLVRSPAQRSENCGFRSWTRPSRVRARESSPAACAMAPA